MQSSLSILFFLLLIGRTMGNTVFVFKTYSADHSCFVFASHWQSRGHKTDARETNREKTKAKKQTGVTRRDRILITRFLEESKLLNFDNLLHPVILKVRRLIAVKSALSSVALYSLLFYILHVFLLLSLN